MKRTSLMLDEQLLKEAVRLLGTKTYSETVNKALAEAVRKKKMLGIRKFFGSGLWEGDLAEMRGDSPRRPAKRSRSTRRRP